MSPDVKTDIMIQDKDFSMIGLFFQADPIVKGVMILLIFLSIWCWAIILEKSFSFKKERKKQLEFEELFWSGVDLNDLYEQLKNNFGNSFERIFGAGMNELSKLNKISNEMQLSNFSIRLQNAIQITINKDIEKLEKGMLTLASIGSIAPFIGLFGTVWGIVNAFQSIAISNNTSLAVVAPGIAEALFATALGLVAAIPSVAAYNKYSNDLDKINSQLEYFAIEFSSILLRRLEKS